MLRLLPFLLAVLAAWTTATGAAAAVVAYEAETAVRSNATVATSIKGFTGSGYVDIADAVGSYVEFTVTVGSSGRARISFIHSASTGSNRLVEVSLNGQVVAGAARLNFGRTGVNNWQPRSIWIVLSAGTNRIRLTSLTAAGGPNIDRIEVDDAYAPTTADWNKAVASTIMTRYPTSASVGKWHYTSTLLMQGLLDVAVRTGNTALQTYIRSWVDSKIDASGAVIAPLDELNDFQGGTLLLRLFDLTGDVRYRDAAAGIYARYASYPTTSDGAWLQHTTYPGRQLWLDGTFMSVPFALEYG